MAILKKNNKARCEMSEFRPSAFQTVRAKRMSEVTGIWHTGTTRRKQYLKSS